MLFLDIVHIELVNLEVRLIGLKFLSIVLYPPCITELLVLQYTTCLCENDTAWMVAICKEVKIVTADFFNYLKLVICEHFCVSASLLKEVL